MINLFTIYILLYNVFIIYFLVVSIQWIQTEDESLYTIWSLVMVRQPVTNARG